MPNEVRKLPEQRGFQSTPLGAALGAFGESVYESLVPQSIEELALELSPVGKAIGLIPPKYVRPLVDALKNRVLNRPGLKYAGIIEEAIDRQPNVAANLADITTDITEPGIAGEFRHSYRSQLDPYSIQEDPLRYGITPDKNDPGWQAMLDAAVGGNITPARPYMPSIGLAEDFTRPELLKMNPRSTMRHEMTHAAQSLMGNLTPQGGPGSGQALRATFKPGLQGANDARVLYSNRPAEIGARISEKKILDPQNFDYATELEKELKQFSYLPGDYVDPIIDYISRKAPTAKRIVPQTSPFLKSGYTGFRLEDVMPTFEDIAASKIR